MYFKETHDFSTTQVDLPDELAVIIREFAATIPDEDLADDEREGAPHVTVLYGIRANSPKAIIPLLSSEPPVTLRFGKTSIFEASDGADYDVVKVDVMSSDLRRLNKKLVDAIPHAATWPTYEPHATIAYVKAGEGKKYAGKDILAGKTLTADRITFSSKGGKKTTILLSGEKQMTEDTCSHCQDTGTDIETSERCEHCEAGKQMGEPEAVDVHTPAPRRRRKDDHFYQKMMEMMKPFVTEEQYNEMVKKARAHAGGKEKGKMAQAAGEMSWNMRIREVSAALSNKYRRDNEPNLYWDRDVFDDHVIAESSQDGTLYRIPYMREGEEIVFGQPVEVEIEYEDVRAASELAVMCRGRRDVASYALFNEFPRSAAEAPAWIPLMPKPGSYKHKQYGTIKITKERNERFLANIQKHVYQENIPIDLEHETKLSGAAGYITNARMNEDESLDAKADWTVRGKKALKEDRFKYFSPEWFDKWIDPMTSESFNDVIIGGALTTRPFFKEKALRPLIASEHVILDSNPKEERQMAEDNDNPPVDAKKFAEMEEELKQLTAKATSAESELTTIKQAAEAKDKELKAATETIAGMQKEARTKRFSDIVSGKAEGVSSLPWFGEREHHLSMLEGLSATYGEDSEQVKKYIAHENSVAEAVNKSKVFDELGHSRELDTSSPSAKLDAAAKKIMAEDKGLSYEQAYTRACSENEDLYRQAQN